MWTSSSFMCTVVLSRVPVVKIGVNIHQRLSSTCIVCSCVLEISFSYPFLVTHFPWALQIHFHVPYVVQLILYVKSHRHQDKHLLLEVTSCVLVDMYQRYGGTYHRHLQGKIMVLRSTGTLSTKAGGVISHQDRIVKTETHYPHVT